MTASIFGLITFILGGFAGFALYHYYFRLSNQERKMLQEMTQAQHELKKYHEEVEKSLTESAVLVEQLHNTSRKLHDHMLHASVTLNRSHHKQSILQPVLHAAPVHHDEEDEQVTEFHPAQVAVKETVSPPKDYI